MISAQSYSKKKKTGKADGLTGLEDKPPPEIGQTAAHKVRLLSQLATSKSQSCKIKKTISKPA
jgi:hypothetical protein